MTPRELAERAESAAPEEFWPRGRRCPDCGHWLTRRYDRACGAVVDECHDCGFLYEKDVS